MYKLFIAWRFLWSRLVSYIGAGLLAVAVALFIVVMAVMEGMGELLRENIRKSDAHVQLLAPAGPGIAEWRKLSERVRRMEHVKGVTPFIQGYGQAESRHYRFHCLVRGVDIEGERELSGLGRHLEGKSLERRERGAYPGMIVGKWIAEKMEMDTTKAGDDRERVRLSVHQADAGEGPGRMMFEVAGEFDTGSIWFDKNLIISLEEAQRMFGTGDRVTGLGVWLGDDEYRLAHEVKRDIQFMILEDVMKVRLDDEEKALFRRLSSRPQTPEEVADRAGIELGKARELVSRLVMKLAAREVGRKPGHYVESTEPQVTTWGEQHPDLFSAVAHEATIMRFILVIVTGFVAVLILCLLWVMVEQKVRDIGTLVALGARAGGVVAVFVLDGLFVGLVGTAIGLGAGTLVAWKVDAITKFLHLKVFPAELFYGTMEVPHRILWADLVLISAVAIACSVVASVLPALKAAAADPIESLRHE